MGDNIDNSRNSWGPNDVPSEAEANNSYVLSGKIMLSAIVVLFFVVILMFALHLYARWYLQRSRRRRSHHRRHSRRAQFIFYVDPNSNAASGTARGLDARVLKSLPVFAYSSDAHPDSGLECAVCLSEFEENESGRVLPKCKHSFHLECIDMWFQSHSTCPLCRTPVEESVPVPVSDNPGYLVLSINELPEGESGSNGSSELRAGTPPAAFGSAGKLSIEVPKRNGESFEGESSGCDSGPSQSYRSPMSRMLSFKRILSRERKNSSPVNTGSCAPVTQLEADIERGVGETRQTQS